MNNTNIGTYNKCEIIEIFGFNKEKNEAFNIYTLIVFENTKQENMKNMLTEKPQSFKGHENISWGIQRRVIELEKAKKLYNELLEKNEYKIDKFLNTGRLVLLPEQYVPPMESIHKAIQINNILKNNFHNGSYILEFFNEEKKNVQFLLDNPILLNNFSEQVSSILPIKIGTLSDRLGNIIFQLPINSIKIHHNAIFDKTAIVPKLQGFNIEVFPKINSFDIKNLIIRIYEENETITRHRIITVKDKVTEIPLDDSFATFLEIIDKSFGLLLYRFRVYLRKYMNNNIHLIGQQKRVFELNGQKIQLEVANVKSNVYGKIKDKAFNEWIQDRKYEEQLKELEKSKAFVQYFGYEKKYIILGKFQWIIQSKKYELQNYQLHQNQLVLISNAITKAVKEIRELINQYGRRGVYIWDPYLSAIDIKNTLYYAKNTSVPMKAISGLKQDNSKKKVKQEMLDEFQKDKQKFLFLDLEVRGKIGSHGYDFHDRFIIFPLEKPKVWSLGISINQLGKSHHILQEVKHAQHILNAFDKLWDELNHEECLVWKSK